MRQHPRLFGGREGHERFFKHGGDVIMVGFHGETGVEGDGELLLVFLAAPAHFDGIPRHKPSRLQQPTVDRNTGGELTRFPGKDDKHGLRHFLGQMWIPHLPCGHRANQTKVFRNQAVKRPLVTLNISGQKVPIIHNKFWPGMKLP
jgi:hypothetical protein